MKYVEKNIQGMKNIYFGAYQLFHRIDKNKVMFESIGGKYCDNPRAISECLHDLDPSIELVWSVSFEKANIKDIPQYIRLIDNNNRKLYYQELGTSAAFITSIVMPLYKKRKGQYFVQTWHGDRGFKKVLYDSEFVPTDFALAEEKPNYCDLAVAGSDFAEREYRSAFHYKGEVLKVGMPRNDCLLKWDKKLATEIKRNVGLPEEFNYLLYAPTLRRDNQNHKSKQHIQNINISRTLDVLRNKTDKRWKCLLRAHPAIVDLDGIEANDEVINVTKIEDMSCLLYVSDMLITDYSSCAGDFALTGRPVVLFQDDVEEYLAKDRGFYFNIEDSPYFVARSQKELENIISNMSSECAKTNCEEILRFYGTHENGNSSEIIAKRIIQHIRDM